MPSSNTPVISLDSKALTSTPSDACTAACTSEPKNANADALNATSSGTPPQAPGTLDTDQGIQAAAVAHQGSEGEGINQGDPLARLAAELGNLSPADRERLAAMLTGRQGKDEGGTA
jgi:hypothetical protein